MSLQYIVQLSVETNTEHARNAAFVSKRPESHHRLAPPGTRLPKRIEPTMEASGGDRIIFSELEIASNLLSRKMVEWLFVGRILWQYTAG